MSRAEGAREGQPTGVRGRMRRMRGRIRGRTRRTRGRMSVRMRRMKAG